MKFFEQCQGAVQIANYQQRCHIDLNSSTLISISEVSLNPLVELLFEKWYVFEFGFFFFAVLYNQKWCRWNDKWPISFVIYFSIIFIAVYLSEKQQEVYRISYGFFILFFHQIWYFMDIRKNIPSCGWKNIYLWDLCYGVETL